MTGQKAERISSQASFCDGNIGLGKIGPVGPHLIDQSTRPVLVSKICPPWSRLSDAMEYSIQ